MDSWILLSLFSALLWAGLNILDKYTLTRWVRTPNVPLVIMGVTGFAASAAIYAVIGISALGGINLFLALAAGVLYILMAYFYYLATQIEEISRIIPLFYLNILFIAVLAAVFLGEIFPPAKYAGMLSMMAGAALISSKNSLKIKAGNAFWLVMLAGLMVAMNSVIIKYLLGFADFWSIFAYTRIGAFLAIIPVAYSCRREYREIMAKHGAKVPLIIFLNEALNNVAIISLTAATAIGYVTLVNAIAAIQPFFVLLFAVALSRFYPKILQEEIGKSVIAQKLLAIILIFAGVVLVA